MKSSNDLINKLLLNSENTLIPSIDTIITPIPTITICDIKMIPISIFFEPRAFKTPIS